MLTSWVVLPGVALIAVLAGDVHSLARSPVDLPGHSQTLVHRDLGRLVAPALVVSSAAARRDGAVRALLDRRATAVRQHDEAAFLATVDPSESGVYARERQTFENLAAVPFGSFGYSIDTGPADERPRLPQYGSAASFTPNVTVSYALSGYDARPVQLHEAYTFVRRARGWLLGGDQDLAASGTPGDVDLWDSGPVIVVHGQGSLVLAHPQAADLAQLVASEADRDIPDVTAIWGNDWAQKVVIELPTTQHELGQLIHENGDLSQIAAVQSTELATTASGAPEQVGDRVAVNPVPFGELSAVGRRVVLTHEITHVASRRSTNKDVPLWLVEGLADYAGFQRSGLPVPTVAQELNGELRAGHVPNALPTDDDFRAANPDLAAVYEQAWLACRLISERYGQGTLVRLYRTVGASQDGDSALQVGLAQVLHTSLPAFTASWRAELRTESG